MHSAEVSNVAAVVAVGAGVIIWGTVVRKAVRERASLPLLALVLVVAGLLFAQAFALVGIPAPGAWSFLGVGIALLILWPRHRVRHTCPICGRPHEVDP